MSEVRIPYQPNKLIFLMIVLFCGLCAWVMMHTAMNNDRGLIINHIIELSPKSATVFYWVMSLLIVMFAGIGMLALGQSIFSNREIIITDVSLTSPKSGISSKLVTVKFSDITRLYIHTIQHTKILRIEYVGGKLAIPNSMLPNKMLFDELVALVSAHTQC